MINLEAEEEPEEEKKEEKVLNLENEENLAQNPVYSQTRPEEAQVGELLNSDHSSA